MNRFVLSVAVLLGSPVALAAGSGAMTQADADRVEAGGRGIATERRERHVILMPIVGVWDHAFSTSGWTARPGPMLGLDVKIEPVAWLHVRASALHGKQPVEADQGRFAEGFDVYQPTLDATRLQLRAEPTLALTSRFSLYLGIGVGWGRLVAPEATATPRLHSYDRTGVYLGYEGAVGFCYELLPDRLVLDLSAAAALMANQSGSMFHPVQAFTDAGGRTTLGGLPHFAASYRSALGLGFVL